MQLTRRTHHFHARGQGLVEYALILVLVGIVSIVILSTTGQSIAKIFCSVRNSLGSACGVQLTVTYNNHSAVVVAVKNKQGPVTDATLTMTDNIPGAGHGGCWQPGDEGSNPGTNLYFCKDIDTNGGNTFTISAIDSAGDTGQISGVLVGP